MLEFLGLPAGHSEADLHASLLGRLREFLIELGRDFCFIGSEFPVQVGGRDFALDLLFFHRGLNCLVAIELKVGRFEPEYLGKLAFYVEALDHDVKKPHEKPAIGVLLCASKEDEVVEYALSRTASPALIAEYQTQLPDKALLQAKLHEFWLAGHREEGGRSAAVGVCWGLGGDLGTVLYRPGDDAGHLSVLRSMTAIATSPVPPTPQHGPTRRGPSS